MNLRNKRTPNNNECTLSSYYVDTTLTSYKISYKNSFVINIKKCEGACEKRSETNTNTYLYSFFTNLFKNSKKIAAPSCIPSFKKGVNVTTIKGLTYGLDDLIVEYCFCL